MDCRVKPGNDRAETGKGVACQLVPQGGIELDRYLRVLIDFFLET